MFKSSPVWGVGYGAFTDFHERTAHNSFVLCFSELGLVGYFIWLALLLITIVEVRSLKKLSMEDPQDREFHRWGRAIELALYAFLGAALFLSRTYVLTLYLLLGLGVALVDLTRREGKQVASHSLVGWVSRIGTLVAASIAFIYFSVRIGQLW